MSPDLPNRALQRHLNLVLMIVCFTVHTTEFYINYEVLETFSSYRSKTTIELQLLVHTTID